MTDNMSFDPNSTDAMFAKVLTKLEEQATLLAEIRENGRLTELEIAKLKSWRDNMQGRVAIIASVVSAAAAYAISHLSK